MHVNTDRCAAYPVSRVRWVDGVAGQVGGWREGLLGHKKSVGILPSYGDYQRQIIEIMVSLLITDVRLTLMDSSGQFFGVVHFIISRIGPASFVCIFEN